VPTKNLSLLSHEKAVRKMLMKLEQGKKFIKMEVFKSSECARIASFYQGSKIGSFYCHPFLPSLREHEPIK